MGRMHVQKSSSYFLTLTKHNYIDLYLADCIGDGRGYTKRPKASVFMPRVKVAIENAKMIRDHSERIPGGLSTDVYKLVEKLIK